MSGSAVEPDIAFERRLEIRKPTYDYDKNVGQVPQLNLTLRLIVGLKYASRPTTEM